MKTYQHIGQLPFLLFERCIVHKDYQVLVIEGEVTVEVLQTAWLLIYSQYCELIEDLAAKDIARDTAIYNALSLRISAVTIAVTLLYQYYYNQELDRVITLIKPDMIERARLEKSLKAPGAKHTGPEPTEAHYTELLMDISKVEGVNIQKKDITAEQFALYIKRLKKHYELLTAKNKK